ncbi:hypothetical protein BpHYR1_027050 [Brachionus plicatilis]|uniref:Uncharacterized protein n=1 Tax=Brachionus plicatilis TaxID=10195 RepID=A0A3M7PUK3_BRAPC|nr:hypothetical protein BpHYR1_027050 [Brachionus plicatilis]
MFKFKNLLEIQLLKLTISIERDGGFLDPPNLMQIIITLIIHKSILKIYNINLEQDTIFLVNSLSFNLNQYPKLQSLFGLNETKIRLNLGFK